MRTLSGKANYEKEKTVKEVKGNVVVMVNLEVTMEGKSEEVN